MISAEDRQRLLEIARLAVVATLTGQPHPQPQAEGDLTRAAGAFVTLHVHGQLRGCIGRLEDDAPLAQTVADCARSASTEDPRFPAVSLDEIDQLDLEISVLGRFEPVASRGEIVIGQHGLLVESKGRRGLLLPQVATEYQWTAEMFVEQTCRKAGLSRDSWSRGEAVLYRFDAEVFGEDRGWGAKGEDRG